MIAGLLAVIAALSQKYETLLVAPIVTVLDGPVVPVLAAMQPLSA